MPAGGAGHCLYQRRHRRAFPGETREDSMETLSLVRQVKFVSLFTFIFSPRKGTPAARMPDPIPGGGKIRLVQGTDRYPGGAGG